MYRGSEVKMATGEFLKPEMTAKISFVKNSVVVLICYVVT